MERKRISDFFDASVIFTASASPTGASLELMRLVLRREIRAVISEFALEEAARNLERKRVQALPIFRLLVETIPFEIVEPSVEEVLAMRPHTAYKDAAILAAAKKAQVDYLATLDRRHMIELRAAILAQVGLRILLPSELLQIIRQHD